MEDMESFIKFKIDSYKKLLNVESFYAWYDNCFIEALRLDKKNNNNNYTQRFLGFVSGLNIALKK